MALLRTLLTVVIVLAAAFGVVPTAGAVDAQLRIDVLSNRADLISGGDALVRVRVPAGVRPASVVVTVGGKRITSLKPTDSGQLKGLITGLAVGRNAVIARAPGARGARLVIVNHPSGGPVIAGPQVQPWICDNAAGGNREPRNKKCSTRPTYELQYQSAPGVFRPYDPDSPPSDVRSTTTDQGKTVPYIVRIERGTMDRGNYAAAVLWNVKANRPTAWNHKLLVPFGASTAVHHKSGAPTSVMDDFALGRGFLVANNSLNVHGQNANDVVSAEALMMLKERIVERYGRIRYTLGNGCSGGALQQYMLSSMYPGLLDGIQPTCSYPDVFTTAPDVIDCHLLIHYFNTTSREMWGNERERTAVTGHRDQSNCAAWEATFSSALEPSRAQNCALPQEQVYDENTNPTGVRCTIPDYMKSIFGLRDPSRWGPVEQQINRGFARVPADNVGVQYGLQALADGDISPEQFVDLNAKIGGISVDKDFVPERIEGDPGAIDTLYRTGQVSDARQWAKVPIIDVRGYSESSEIHTSFYSYTSRARLDAALGHHDNQLIWTFAPAVPIVPVPPPTLAQRAFLLLDQWVAAIEADERRVPLAQKVRDAKPEEATDMCFSGDQAQPPESCEQLYPPYAVARTVAGAPLANDIVKCALQPLDRAAYSVDFTDEQWAALEDAFPGGVCDYGRPGVSQQPGVPWQTYAGGPGGRPLGPAPTSVPLPG